ncbi:MAG: SMC family ATPase [Thaumarchaeota archaeon]|nr:SMC family ATPase [Nitrososphaerota archaeon]
MIIKEVEMVNVRSHGHSLIKFPEGKTLLEGDIGSGKSSILMAIEFALFGLGADSGNSVLKLGQESGEVRLVFEVDGSEYEVTRRLQRKSGRVQQAGGELKMPTETLDLSPSELKEKVLEILEFNEAPDPKAQSWIYRYAVYTPQEEMKYILTLAPDQRLQILRRAFRVEDYKTAATNAEEAIRTIREDARELDGVARGMDELKGKADELRQEEESRGAELGQLEVSASSAEKQVSLLKMEGEKLQRTEMSLQRVRGEKEHYERLRLDSDRDAADLEGEVGDLKERLAKVEASLEARSKRPPKSRPLAELKRKQRSLESRAKKLTGLKGAVESKLADYESIMRRGVCPVCDRPVKAHDFDDRTTRKEAEKDHVAGELKLVEANLLALREKIEKAQAYLEAVRQAALLRSELAGLRRNIASKEKSKKKFENRSRFARDNLQQIAKDLEELEEVVDIRQTAERKLLQAEDALRKAREDMVRAKERLESIQKEQTRTASEIVAKEEAANKSRKVREREIWLRDYFVPTVKVIETSVLATINQDFDSLFKRWFGMLVNDPDKEVSVDGDFTPVVTEGGYEQDVRYLSGGERTSMALAYRLSLNILAQMVSVGMRSNLLILDEPTDGFSKEQLGNVREVLDEVGSPQVIIVSHDKELESFADQIFRVEKTGSESTVSMPK